MDPLAFTPDELEELLADACRKAYRKGVKAATRKFDTLLSRHYRKHQLESLNGTTGEFVEQAKQELKSLTVLKTRDASGHEHATDGKFTGPGGGGSAATESADREVVGRGNTGEVYRDGGEVVKQTRRPDGTPTREGEHYESLRGTVGLAPGRQDGGTVRLPHYQEVLSVDTVPDAQARLSMGSEVGKNKTRLLNVANALAEQNLDYNDPLQVGFDDNYNAHVIDLSNAGRVESQKVALRANIDRVVRFLSDFGAEHTANAIQRTFGVLNQSQLLSPKDAERRMAALAEKGNRTAQHIVSMGAEQVATYGAKYAYYATNPRPVLRDVLQSEPDADGVKVVLSKEPLDADTIRQYGLTPVVHPAAKEPVGKSLTILKRRDATGHDHAADGKFAAKGGGGGGKQNGNDVAPEEGASTQDVAAKPGVANPAPAQHDAPPEEHFLAGLHEVVPAGQWHKAKAAVARAGQKVYERMVLATPAFLKLQHLFTALEGPDDLKRFGYKPMFDGTAGHDTPDALRDATGVGGTLGARLAAHVLAKAVFWLKDKAGLAKAMHDGDHFAEAAEALADVLAILAGEFGGEAPDAATVAEALRSLDGDHDPHAGAAVALLDHAVAAAEAGEDVQPGLDRIIDLLDSQDGGEEVEKAFDEGKHPRDDSGRFVSRDAIADAKGDPAKEAALRERVTDPEQRKKLDAALGGDTDLGRTKRGQARADAAERRKTRQASKEKATEVLRKIRANGEVTADDVRDLADHLPALTVAELRLHREALMAKLGGRRVKDQYVRSLVEHAKGKAAGGEVVAESQPVPGAAPEVVPETPAAVASAGVKEPWQMTAREHQAALDNLRPNAQGTGGDTRGGMGRSTSEAGLKRRVEGIHAERDRLLGGRPASLWVRYDENDKPYHSTTPPKRGDQDYDDAHQVENSTAHREIVAEALAAGQPVPPEVLADYPDLAPQPAPAAAGPAPTPVAPVAPAAPAGADYTPPGADYTPETIPPEQFLANSRRRVETDETPEARRASAASAWVYAHRLGRPELAAAVEPLLEEHGVGRFGTPGEVVPFNGRYHQTGRGVADGQMVRVVRAGLHNRGVANTRSGAWMQERAHVEPAEDSQSRGTPWEPPAGPAPAKPARKRRRP